MPSKPSKIIAKIPLEQSIQGTEQAQGIMSEVMKSEVAIL